MQTNVNLTQGLLSSKHNGVGYTKMNSLVVGGGGVARPRRWEADLALQGMAGIFCLPTKTQAGTP